MTVALLTTKVRNIPAEVAVGLEEGLPRPCVINTDNLRTIPKSDLLDEIGRLGAEKTKELNNTLRFSLGLD